MTVTIISSRQVVDCKDTIAQSYLMDCVIQVFPDEFHLASLEAFLEGVCRLKEKVRVRPVLESLMERIGNYVEEHPGTLPKDVSLAKGKKKEMNTWSFSDILPKSSTKIIKSRPTVLCLSTVHFLVCANHTFRSFFFRLFFVFCFLFSRILFIAFRNFWYNIFISASFFPTQ